MLPLMIRAGRGNSGGTTALLATLALAYQDKRAPIIVDAARNPGLKLAYPDAIRPESHAPKAIKSAVQSALDVMLEYTQGGVIDLGGGQDDTIVELNREFNIVEFGKDAGVRPVFVITFGPDMGDFDHVLEVKSRGIFKGADVILVCSEGVLRPNQDADDAFGKIVERKEFEEWVNSGAKVMFLRYLAPLEKIKQDKISLIDEDLTKKLGYTRAWQVKKWLRDWRDEFKANNCDDWRV